MKEGTIILQLRGRRILFAGLYASSVSVEKAQSLVHKAEKFAKEAENEGDNINSAFDQFLEENGVVRIIAEEVSTNELF